LFTLLFEAWFRDFTSLRSRRLPSKYFIISHSSYTLKVNTALQ